MRLQAANEYAKKSQDLQKLEITQRNKFNEKLAKRQKFQQEIDNAVICLITGELKIAKGNQLDIQNNTLHLLDKLYKMVNILKKEMPSIIQNLYAFYKSVNRYNSQIWPTQFVSKKTYNELTLIANLIKCQWIRDINLWKPIGKSFSTKLRSLINWLIVKYPVPEFMYSTLEASDESMNFMPLFIFLADGGSMKEALNLNLLKGAQMTHKMNHYFLNAPSNYSILQAIRYAQVMGLGGNYILAAQINLSMLGRADNIYEMFTHDEFCIKLIEWFCHQTQSYNKIEPLNIHYDQINLIVDWYRTKFLEKDFSLKGRTFVSVLENVIAWHDELKNKKIRKYYNYMLSGFKEWKEEDKEGNTWSIIEIKNSNDLHTEGSTQKHCVYSYEENILYQISSIWSLRFNNEIKITIELLNRSKKIIQAKGKCNRSANEDEVAKIKIWANLNHLTIESYVLGG